MLTVSWRKTWPLPGALFATPRYGAEYELREVRLVPDEDPFFPGSSRRPAEPPTSWAGVLLGILPFWLFGLAYLIQAASELGWLAGWPTGLVQAAPLVAYGGISLGLILAWIMGFPRWSLAYLGLALYFGYDYSHGQIYGVRYGLQGWLPLLTGLVVGLLVSRTFIPVLDLLHGFWDDWSRLSYVIYACLLPVVTIIFFDGDWGRLEFYGLIFDILLLSVGAAVFMRSRTILKKAASLQLVMIVLLVRGVWMGGWFDGPAHLIQLGLPTLAFLLVFWGGLMFAPGLLDLLRRGLGGGRFET